MQFKCNFCERTIPTRLFGAPVIKCHCGAAYRKQVTVEVVEDTPPPSNKFHHSKGGDQ